LEKKNYSEGRRVFSFITPEVYNVKKPTTREGGPRTFASRKGKKEKENKRAVVPPSEKRLGESHPREGPT